MLDFNNIKKVFPESFLVLNAVAIVCELWRIEQCN